MNVIGQKSIQAERDKVWKLLMEPKVLQAVIPGCKYLDKVDNYVYHFEIELKVAAIVGKYTGKIEIVNPEPLSNYGLKVEGSGALGNMEALVWIELQPLEEKNKTNLSFNGEAKIEGKVAKVGQRVLSSVANLVINQFFNGFAKEIKQYSTI